MAMVVLSLVKLASGEEAYALSPTDMALLMNQGSATSVVGGGVAIRVAVKRLPPQKVALEPGQIVRWFPTEGSRQWGVTAEALAAFQTAFPHVDVRQQVEQMISWLRTNQARRKTPQGMPRFVNAWLARAEARLAPAKAPFGSRFTESVNQAKEREAREKAATEAARQSWEVGRGG